MEEYKYTGKYKAEERSNKRKTNNSVSSYFYALLYPVSLKENGDYSFSQEVINKRISPTGINQVKISGSNGVFLICKYNENYVLLDNKNKKDEKREIYLASRDSICSRNLFESEG